MGRFIGRNYRTGVKRVKITYADGHWRQYTSLDPKGGTIRGTHRITRDTIAFTTDMTTGMFDMFLPETEQRTHRQESYVLDNVVVCDPESESVQKAYNSKFIVSEVEIEFVNNNVRIYGIDKAADVETIYKELLEYEKSGNLPDSAMATAAALLDDDMDTL